MKHIKIFLLSIIFSLQLSAQLPDLNINLVLDNSELQVGFFAQSIQEEIDAILSPYRDIHFEFSYLDTDYPKQIIQNLYEDINTDIIIAVGMGASMKLSALGDYPKPTIISLVFDSEVQGIPVTTLGTSGIKNLSFIQSPFNIEKDLKTLYEIKPYKKIAIIGGLEIRDVQIDFDKYLEGLLSFSGASFDFYPVSSGVESILTNLSEDTEAAYIFPISNFASSEKVKTLIDGLNERGLPTFSLMSSPLLNMGVYASYENEGNIRRIPRRVALNAMKIAEGLPTEDIPVGMPGFTEDLIINFETVKRTGHYPEWKTLSEAILINVNSDNNAQRVLTLESAIAEGLQNNPGIQFAQKEEMIAGKNVALAKGNYLPQLQASTSLLTLDKNTINNAFGTKGYLNWAAGASLSQLILSEPALANIAIQELLREGKSLKLEQSMLDMVLDVANAYLNILLASELVELRNENVNVTRRNYNIAREKENVGYSGTTDVYRWESKLAVDHMDLNSAMSQLEQARYFLNNLLNRPINEEFRLNDISMSDSIITILDNRLFQYINNPGSIDKLADFLVSEAFYNLPEIKQLETSIRILKRSLLSRKRAFYTPSIALSGEYQYPIDNFIFPDGLMEIEGKPTYNAVLGLQFPIFEGNNRKHAKEQSQLEILQLQDQTTEVRNLMELQVRSNMEVAGASFSNLNLSKKAAEAAGKNLEIAQNSYQQGLLNVTSLIDAQNAYLQSTINATNAEYFFISDYLTVDRAIGYFSFLAAPEERETYYQRFVNFFTQK